MGFLSRKSSRGVGAAGVGTDKLVRKKNLSINVDDVLVRCSVVFGDNIAFKAKLSLGRKILRVLSPRNGLVPRVGTDTRREI